MEDALSRVEEWPRVLILRLHLVSAMDVTGLNALESVVERMKSHKGTVIFSGIHQQPLQMLRKAGFIDIIGKENFQPTFDDALDRARNLLASGSTHPHR
jgi:SulP family sulfate permease